MRSWFKTLRYLTKISWQWWRLEEKPSVFSSAWQDHHFDTFYCLAKLHIPMFFRLRRWIWTHASWWKTERHIIGAQSFWGDYDTQYRPQVLGQRAVYKPNTRTGKTWDSYHKDPYSPI